jgi:hypothetical protein
VEGGAAAEEAAPVHRKAGGPSDSEVRFVGDKIPDDEARRRWPERYKAKVRAARSKISAS